MLISISICLRNVAICMIVGIVSILCTQYVHGYTMVPEDYAIQVHLLNFVIQEAPEENPEERFDSMSHLMQRTIRKNPGRPRLHAILSETIEILESHSHTPAEKSTAKPTTSHTGSTKNYDADLVESTWIGRVNELRNERGLTPYTVDTSGLLRYTCEDWARELSKKGKADHRRYPHSGYYDYRDITDRFEERGVVFKNIGGSTHTENIGRATYACDDDECTDEILDSIRRVFDYFVSEESYNGVHWRTMVHKTFQTGGVGVRVDEAKGKVYVVAHYGTELE